MPETTQFSRGVRGRLCMNLENECELSFIVASGLKLALYLKRVRGLCSAVFRELEHP